ncbi:AMIN domain-containing protein [Microcoleus sp. herbarium14]|uniref:AMIN domain-containing protein n=1 Tax=Microcoleus sp. herbarium14 TaxID=3055439 RepID=UPI002FD246E1
MPNSSLNQNFHPAAMQYKRFWADLQKLTVNSLASRLFASKSLTLSLAVAAAVSTQIGQQPASASTVPTWQFDPATNELIIALPEGTTPKYSVLNSRQIAVDLPNTEIGIDATQLYPEGMVRSVGISQIQRTKARIVVDLAPGFAVVSDRTVFQKVGAANRWVLVPAIAPSAIAQTAETQARSTREVPQDRSATTPNSAPTAPLTYDRDSSQQATQNDQIRPITVPLVRVAVQERRGIPVAPAVRPSAPEQRIINFGEPLPKQ